MTSRDLEHHPMWIDAVPVHGTERLTVTSPFTALPVGTTTFADAELVERALASALAVRHELAAIPLHVRSTALRTMGDALLAEAEAIASLISEESGKPIAWARPEVDRAASVFHWAAELARQWSGEVARLDGDPAGEGRIAFTSRVPRGVVLAISPFNFPLNLAAHKVAPAIAVGSPVILKPAPKTPLSGLILGRLAAEAGLPAGAVAVVNVPDSAAGDLVADHRVSVVSFTGSAAVGDRILRSVPEKHVTLELGGNAAVVIGEDVAAEGQQLRAAVDRIALLGNSQAGQSCVSVQRILVPRAHYQRVREELITAVSALRNGDPADPSTQVGPMIDAPAADRIETWVADAVQAGAVVLAGGQREATMFQPTLLEGVPADSPLVCEEAFGPVMVLLPYDDIDDAFRQVNDSRYGLQAGVFTRDLTIAFRAHRELDVGGVIIGDVPTYRSDQMAYGGVKDSGVGREGVRYAMEDYTVEKVLVLSGVPL